MELREWEISRDLAIATTCDLGMSIVASGPCCCIKPEDIKTSFWLETKIEKVSLLFQSDILQEL